MPGVVFAVVVVAAVLGGCVAASTGTLASVVVTPADVTVHVRGLRFLLALRRTISIPLADISAASVVDPRRDGLGLRLPGTALPGVFYAGMFGLGDSRTFVIFGRKRKALRIDVAKGRYKRLLLEVADPDRAAREIEAARPGSRR